MSVSVTSQYINNHIVLFKEPSQVITSSSSCNSNHTENQAQSSSSTDRYYQHLQHLINPNNIYYQPLLSFQYINVQELANALLPIGATISPTSNKAALTLGGHQDLNNNNNNNNTNNTPIPQSTNSTSSIVSNNVINTNILPYSALLCTSTNGVQSIQNALQQLSICNSNNKIDLTTLTNIVHNLPLFVVGQGTGKSAIERGHINICTPNDHFNYLQAIQKFDSQFDVPDAVIGGNRDALYNTKQNAVQLGLQLVYLYKYLLPSQQQNNSKGHNNNNNTSTCQQSQQDISSIELQLDYTKPILILSSSIRQDTLTSILTYYKVPFIEYLTYETTTSHHGLVTSITNIAQQITSIPPPTVPIPSKETYSNSFTFCVYFSPSGLQCILKTITFIYNIILQAIQNETILDVDNYTLYHNYLTFFTNPKNIPIAIGATTKKAIYETIQPQIEQYKTILIEAKQQYHTLQNNMIDDLYLIFQTLSFSNNLCTCIQPSPQGVSDQVIGFLNNLSTNDASL